MRREFPRRVKSAAFERAAGHCEECTAKLFPGKYHYDHVNPDALGGGPTLENCRVLCTSCHGLKTSTQDVPQIAKANRVRDRHRGATETGRGFQTNRAGKYRKKMNGTIELRDRG